MTFNQRTWYCIRSHPKHEHIAAASLRQLPNVDVFNPQLRIRRATKRGPVHFLESLFPGYLFAQFVLSQTLEGVKYARGVSSVVHFADKIPTIPDTVIEDLRSTMELNGETIFTEAPAEGEEVEICSGPFQGQEAVVLRVLPAKQRIQVLLEVMGRTTTTEISLNAILLERSNPASVIPELAVRH